MPEKYIVLLEDTDIIGLKRGKFKGPRFYFTTKPENFDKTLIRPGPADLTLLRQYNQKLRPKSVLAHGTPLIHLPKLITRLN